MAKREKRTMELELISLSLRVCFLFSGFGDGKQRNDSLKFIIRIIRTRILGPPMGRVEEGLRGTVDWEEEQVSFASLFHSSSFAPLLVGKRGN